MIWLINCSQLYRRSLKKRLLKSQNKVASHVIHLKFSHFLLLQLQKQTKLKSYKIKIPLKFLKEYLQTVFALTRDE